MKTHSQTEREKGGEEGERGRDRKRETDRLTHIPTVYKVIRRGYVRQSSIAIASVDINKKLCYRKQTVRMLRRFSESADGHRCRGNG